ncbi:MAG: VWA domain-containing protein [Oscillospiraceae bacterium]|nr:VWA domain-containing protein [Oscillospiraceae bacterium]MBQ2792720.1 VWA domain-containing protein [Oscillospiraceae bacterium]MBQ3242916.1 VWA domain-containing protein [Oscillospiraceae bacterium]MBR2636560.1 VWA domain-containing protein [Oscillospiraceae bacterium]
MKNNVTELVFILDKSGSMAGLEKDTIGGFNAMIEKQKKEDGACYVSTVLFSDESQMLHDRLPLEQVPQMTDRDYEVCGCTALLDAIGDCIRHIENIHKYARAEDLPAHTLFVITTDGQENASHRYTGEKIKKMIGRQKEKYGWEFLFIGANIDAVATASRYGIEKDRAVNYLADEKGTRTLFRAVGNAVCSIRNKSSLGADWQREISEDFCSRSRQNG